MLVVLALMQAATCLPAHAGPDETIWWSAARVGQRQVGMLDGGRLIGMGLKGGRF